jgi:transposase
MARSTALASSMVRAASAHVALLIPRLELVDRQRRDCARRLERLRDALATTGEHQGHRDVTILRSLPGVGRVVAATMLAEASRLLAARDYHGLRTQAGVAPVTRQSGKRLLVGMRYACNPRLRNALYYWGFTVTVGRSGASSIVSSPSSWPCSPRRPRTTRPVAPPCSPSRRESWTTGGDHVFANSIR